MRHGQSTNNALRAVADSQSMTTMRNRHYEGRVADPHLSELGHSQAKASAAYLASSAGARPAAGGRTVLYTSRMIRAVQTAAPVSEALDVPTIPRADCHETWGLNDFVDGGPERTGVAGQSLSQLVSHNARLDARPTALSGGEEWDGGRETLDEGFVRAGRFLAAIAHEHGDSSDLVIVVMHQQYAAQVVGNAVGATHDKNPQFWLFNAALTSLFWDGGVWNVRCVNDHQHLRDVGLSR